MTINQNQTPNKSQHQEMHDTTLNPDERSRLATIEADIKLDKPIVPTRITNALGRMANVATNIPRGIVLGEHRKWWHDRLDVRNPDSAQAYRGYLATKQLTAEQNGLVETTSVAEAHEVPPAPLPPAAS